MKESLIGSVVNSVTGAVTSTAGTLTGTTTTSETSTEGSESSTTPTPTVTTTSAPASTTSTPKTTSASPATSTPVVTTAPASTTFTPVLTTSSPTPTAGSSTDSSVLVSDTPSRSTSSSSDHASTSFTPTEVTSSSTVSPSVSSGVSGANMSVTTGSNSGSSLTHLRGSQSHSYTSVSDGSHTGSSSQGSGEAGVTDIADAALSTGSVVGLVLGGLGILLLLVLLVFWCLRRRRRQRMSSINHVRLGAIGNIPVFDTGGTERFETSSSSVSFGPFQTARVTADHGSTSGGTGRLELWEDAVITAMRIPLEKITTAKLLSSGGYGEVYCGVYREETVAVKVLLPEKQKDLQQINAFLAEIKMMATIDHPCIVRFVGVAWDSLSDLSAVMEFMEGGDLRALLDRFKQEERPLGFDLDKARIALQTAQALTYLHSLEPKVLHRDLKSRNILLTSELDAKVSDFGVARKYSFTSMTAAVGTSLWMAPEVMMGDRYGASADIFSFGVVLSELDSHLHPYAEARITDSRQRVPDAALLQLVAMGRASVTFSSSAPAQLVELGRACVSLNPTSRPTASEVHYHLQLIMQTYEMYTL